MSAAAKSFSHRLKIKFNAASCGLYHVSARRLGDFSTLKDVGSRRESEVLVNCSGWSGMFTLPDASLTCPCAS
jgi:hypothetical protein